MRADVVPIVDSTDFLRHMAPRGTVVSFECADPGPTLAGACRAGTVALEPYARRGEGRLLNVMVSDRFSSLAPSHTGTDMFLNSNRVEQQVEWKCTLGKCFLNCRSTLLPAPYLKLDTQGFDLAVWRVRREPTGNRCVADRSVGDAHLRAHGLRDSHPLS